MLHPSYGDLMKVVNSDVEDGEAQIVNSRYSIVLATAKRARQLISGSYPLVIPKGRKPLSVAIDELYKGELKIISTDEDTKDVTPLYDVYSGNGSINLASMDYGIESDYEYDEEDGTYSPRDSEDGDSYGYDDARDNGDDYDSRDPETDGDYAYDDTEGSAFDFDEPVDDGEEYDPEVAKELKKEFESEEMDEDEFEDDMASDEDFKEDFEEDSENIDTAEEEGDDSL